MKRSLLATAAVATLLVGGTAATASADTASKTVSPAAKTLIAKSHTVDLKDVSGTGLRLSGANRYETAVAISQAAWEPEATSIVFLASGVNYPDALVIGPSTGYTGPLLLTDPNKLTDVTATEIARLQPCLVVVVGGTSAVSQATQDAANALADPSQCTAA